MADEGSERWRNLNQEAWDAFTLLHEGLGEILPPGSLPAPEEIDRLYGPTFAHWAEALLEAVGSAFVLKAARQGAGDA